MQSTVLNRLQEVFEKTTGRSDVILSRRTNINDEIGLSSFARIQLICAVEEEFGVEISNSALMKIKTVGDIVKLLNKNGIE